MKLKKLEITGFKSFVDRSIIEFPYGISAVVGPNGCGKSNIVDALRWVMGEQSVKQLRGKSMEDVIFSGTNGKPPLNMAEVSLTLLNDNGTAPEELREFSEIMLTRRLYRSGESAYYLNKQPCRLKDIHNIFLGSGLGSQSYAVIQQGNIGAIIDAGPEDRRTFIEEAAGITRYKTRKKEALRKIDSTQQNLLRVADIMSEISRQMRGLKRQARKAERFKNYQESLKILDVSQALRYYDKYTLQIQETDALLKDLRDTDIEQTTSLKRLDAAVEEIKLKRWKKDQEISDQKSRQFELQRTIDRTENDLSHLREDIERFADEIEKIEMAREELEEKNQAILSEISQVEKQTTDVQQEIDTVSDDLEQERTAAQEITGRLAALNQDLESGKTRLMNCVTQEARYKNTYQNATNNKENLKRRLKRIHEEEAQAEKKIALLQGTADKVESTLQTVKTELADLNETIQSVQQQLKEKSESLGRQVKSVQTLELEQKEIRSRYTTLKKMQENFEWYKDGVQAIMKKATRDPIKDTGDGDTETLDGVLGLMADIIESSPTYSTAIESVLGESLQYVLVEDQTAGVRSIGYLQASGAGRCGFIPVSSIREDADNTIHELDATRLLLNHVTVDPKHEHIARTLLGNVIVAEDIGEALEIWNRNGSRRTIVTKSGEIISPLGMMIGGSNGNGSGILAKKIELKELISKLSDLESRLEKDRKLQEELEKTVRQIETHLQKLFENRHQSAQKETEAEKERFRITEELKHERRHLDIVRLEGEQLLGEESDLDEELAEYNRAISEIETEVNTAQDHVAAISGEIESITAEMEAYSQRVVDVKLKLTSLNAQLENSRTNLRRLCEFKDDGERRLQELVKEIEQKKQKSNDRKQRIVEYQNALSGRYEDIKQLERVIENNATEFQTIEEKLKENDAIISSIKSKRDETLEKLRLLELEQSQRQMKRDNVLDQIGNRYHTPLIQMKTDLASKLESLNKSPEELEAEIEQLRNRLLKMEDVNLGAIKEYETLKERHDFLTEQQTDLEKAIEDLQKVIRKINRITRKRFLETFNLVNEKLHEVFPRLFEGGSAQLVLTEPDNPLETGVEYMIHPPGKKLTRMSLLSGGEKALSAIAFIFSIFLMKPTTFCLMDEIDAPLDDVNIFRFNNLLQIIGEKSQIVMITHNKRTMEFADTLFGVTMEKKGVSKIVSVNFKQPE
jgi:chromosome segregation protein